jgi:hypothetical protein
MKNKKQIILLLLISLTLAACKYDEGPLISFRSVEKRISQGRQVVEFTKDGVDMTQELIDSCGEYWTFHAKNSYHNYELVVLMSSYPEDYVLGAGWSLNSNNKKIRMEVHHTYDGIDPFQDGVTTNWNIHRLTKDDFWLSTTYYNSNYYLKLVANEN